MADDETQVEHIIKNTLSIRKYLEERGQDVVQGLILLGLIKTWLEENPSNAGRVVRLKEADRTNVGFLEPLWTLCRKYGIFLNDRHKVRILAAYLGNGAHHQHH